jgi:hypothetical protein
MIVRIFYDFLSVKLSNADHKRLNLYGLHKIIADHKIMTICVLSKR